MNASPHRIHPRAHLADTRVKADEDCFANEEMPDIEFGELRDRGDGTDVVERQAVARMGFDAVLCRERGGFGQAAQF